MKTNGKLTENYYRLTDDKYRLTVITTISLDVGHINGLWYTAISLTSLCHEFSL